MSFSNFKLMAIVTLISIILEFESFGQPGTHPSVLMPFDENNFTINLDLNNILLVAFIFDDSTYYSKIQNLELKHKLGQDVINDILVREIWNSLPLGLGSTLYSRESIVQVSIIQPSIETADYIYPTMDIFIKMAYDMTWDYQIELVHLDQFIAGSFFYDMCFIETNKLCRVNGDLIKPFPKLYDEHGILSNLSNQILDLSCIEDHRIPENSIIEIITTTNCDDKEAIKRQWEE